MAIAAAMIGLAATRQEGSVWTSPAMISAYSFGCLGAACFVAAVRGFPFPFVASENTGSWTPVGRAAGSSWGMRNFYGRKRGFLEFGLECYQSGATLAALRCEVVTPSGVHAFAENAAGYSFPHDAKGFRRMVFFAYPDDFTGGELPPPENGTYHIVWLGKSAHDAQAVELVSGTYEVELPEAEA